MEHHAETYDDMLLKTDDPVWMKSAPAQRLNSDPWRGTIFTWQVTAMMFAQCIPSVYPAFYALGWDAASTTALFVPAMILHGLVWNSLHPDMHGLPDVPASVGLPSSVMAGLRGSPVFEWLRLNHVGHHVASGQVHPPITGRDKNKWYVVYGVAATYRALLVARYPSPSRKVTCIHACTHDLERALQVNYNVCCPGMDHLVGTFMPEEEWTPKIRVKEAKEIKGALAYESM